MAVKVVVSKSVHVQHAELNTIVKFFKDFYSMGTITITKIVKASAATAAMAGISGAAVVVSFTGPGAAGKAGTEVFAVPGPEIGSGISFAIAASLLGLFALYRSKRSSAV